MDGMRRNVEGQPLPPTHSTHIEHLLDAFGAELRIQVYDLLQQWHNAVQMVGQLPKTSLILQIQKMGALKI
jgi:hypothetical protein